MPLLQSLLPQHNLLSFQGSHIWSLFKRQTFLIRKEERGKETDGHVWRLMGGLLPTLPGAAIMTDTGRQVQQQQQQHSWQSEQ